MTKSAVPDMSVHELQQARRYIIRDQGTAPGHWWEKPVPAVVAGTGREDDPPSNPPVAA
jgi:hypothetical protein